MKYVLIYISIFLLIIYFFMSANCGVIFEPKLYYLSKLPKQYVIPFIGINSYSQLSSLKYPMVFKPDQCTGGGLGVEKINNQQEGKEYLDKMLKPGEFIIAQEYDDRPKEFSVMYERHPFLSSGRIIAITEKIPIERKEFDAHNLGYTERKCNVVNYTNQATPEFNKLIDSITKHVPDFHVGRYDIKASSLDDLLKGNFGILELNGLFGVDHRAYVHTLHEIDFINFFTQLRWLIKRIIVGTQSNFVYNPIHIISNINDEYKKLKRNKDYTERAGSILSYNLFNLVIILISIWVIQYLTRKYIL